jgi:hypothetical protein
MAQYLERRNQKCGQEGGGGGSASDEGESACIFAVPSYR